MTTLLGDMRFALRNLLRTPVFPLAAIGTLALGIGATTAIFSTVNAALLRPLPYPGAGDLYGIRTALTDGRVTTGLLSPAEVFRLNDPSLSIVKAAGLISQPVTLLDQDGSPTLVQVHAVSEGFFELFGLPMTLGGFTHEQYVANGPPVVVISHRVWKERFAGDPAVVGKPIRFAELSTTVAGVTSPAFDTPHGADFWFNLRLDPQGVNHSFDGYLRVKPGTSVERLRGEMATVMAGLARDLPASALNRVYVVKPLVEQIVGDLSSTLVIVLSATALLLILACVNVTNLLLARGAVRSREMAVRVALGASRGRIIRQLLTESVLLATAGAIVGLLVAAAGVRLLMVVGAAKLPRLESVPFDGTVLLFALGALVVSGLFVGFAPALRLASTDVKTLLNESGRSATTGRGTRRWLGAMTVAQIALAVTLVAGAGWLVRGFANARQIDPGFVAQGRLLFDVAPQGPRFRDAGALNTWFQDLFGRLRALPGVTGVGSTSNFPLRVGQENSLFVQLRGETMDPAHPMGSRERSVSVGFFDAMGIKLLEGRDFNADDRADSARVVIVNRTFVKRYLTGKNALQTQFTFGYPTTNPQTESTIVGVVEDVRQKTLMDAAEPAFYSPNAQTARNRQTVVVATTLADVGGLTSAIREAVKKMEPQMALDFQSATVLVGETLQRQELAMTLMLLFGAAAIALAAVGIYGVIAHASAARRGEVATRLALGASRGAVFWLMMRQGRTLAIVGAAIGLATAYAGGRVLASRVYGVHAADPLILGAAMGLVVLIALVATAIPAGRAARTDPAGVLRPE